MNSALTTLQSVRRIAGARLVLSGLVLLALCARPALAQTNFCQAVLARSTVTLRGTVLLDSFNSQDPAHSTGGRYDAAKRQDGGDVASAADGVNVITDTGNTKVYGRFYTGPSGTATVSGSAAVGSLAWVNGGNRGIQPGWYLTNFSAVIPEVALPQVSFSALPQTSGKVNGTNYTYVLTSGNYAASSLNLSGSMCINGNVLLYLTNGLTLSSKGLVYIAPGATLTVYLGGQSQLSGQGVVNGTGFATNCAWFGLPSCTSWQFTGGSDFIGSVYAPQAAVSMSGGGSKVVNFVGAVVANTVSLSGNYQFHFDQALCRDCRPVVLMPPADQTSCPATTVTFNMLATGPGLVYQWYKDGTLLPGQTRSSLVLPNVSAADMATYRVTVAGLCGTEVTASATLTVTALPIIAGPANKTVLLGTPWTFDTPTANYPIKVVGTVTNTSGSCGNGFAATRTWVAEDACGNVSSPCNQTVAVLDTNPIQFTAPLFDQAVCAGTPVTLKIGATGTGLSYAWTFNNVPLSTNNPVVLPNVTTAQAGIYQVVVSDPCGNSLTNSARLTVNPLTTATPLASVVRNLGDSATFATVASGTGPFTYLWKKNGSVIAGQTTNCLTLTNLGSADGAVYQVEVSGVCNTAVQSATLTLNTPPVVTLLSPTNGAVLVAPATFQVLANAYDTDGSVTNVEFFQTGVGKLGQTNAAPYFITLSNVPVGSYTFTARATDNLGAQGVSAPVTITVVSNPPLTIVSDMRFNPQSGLFIQTVRVTNLTSISYNAVRVSVHGLLSGMRVYNASGTNSGVPYVQTRGTIPSGGHAELTIEYYVTTSQTPNPTLVPLLVEPVAGGGVATIGLPQVIDRAVMLANKTFLLEFGSVTNRTYYIQYSSDLRVWQTAEPAIPGTGGRIQWIDNGEPKTASAPGTTPMRFYRLIYAQ